ncbi:MAG: TVP38/TMEM64 family protein, partial [Hyphomicrobiales bacterium]
MNGNAPVSGPGSLPPPSGGAGWLRRYLPLFVLLAAALFVYVMGWHKYLTLEQLAGNRDALGRAIEENYLRSLLVYAAIYVVVVALSLPGGALLTLAGGFLFGWFVGGVATVIAATIGAALIFLVARTSIGEALAARAGPWLGKLRAGFQDNALSYLLFLRLVPVFPFWLVNLAPALLGVPLGTYLIGTFVGIIPGTFAFSYAGVGLDSLIDAQQS